ncbi:MAG: hypothetical protein WC611_06885 [Candidatus Neomarinimicrobiota bacterium]|jgi:hypothetical protein
MIIHPEAGLSFNGHLVIGLRSFIKRREKCFKNHFNLKFAHFNLKQALYPHVKLQYGVLLVPNSPHFAVVKKAYGYFYITHNLNVVYSVTL